MGHAILERARMFGDQSADYITASGHSGRIVTEASLQAKNRSYEGGAAARLLAIPNWRIF
jgi:hypothetical protein